MGTKRIGAINRLGHGQVAKVADPSHQALQRPADRFLNFDFESAEHHMKIPISIKLQFAWLKPYLLGTGSPFGRKHVFVEKPFGQDYEECSKLCKLAKERLQIVVGQSVFIQWVYFASQRHHSIWRSWEILHLRPISNLVKERAWTVWDLTSHDLSIFDFSRSIPQW